MNNNWISVKERLPEDNVVWGSKIGVFNHYRSYLVFNGESVRIGHYRTGIGDKNFAPFWDGEYYWYDYNKVTHWMPLPEPPKK